MKKIFILLAGLGLSVSFGQLTQQAVQSYSNVSLEINQLLLENCNDGALYGDAKYYVGDFSTLFIANQFTVPADTEFSLSELEMFYTVPTGASIVNVEIQIFTDVDGLPGEMIHGEIVEPLNSDFFQNINFTGGETAEEYIITFDLSSYPVLTTTTSSKYWVATKPTISTAPARHMAQDLTRDIPTMLLRTAGWGPLAVTIEPDVPLEVPFSIRGNCETMGTGETYASSFSLYPNPVKDVFNVSLKNADVKSISVTNLSGQVVATSKNSSVNVSTLPAGVYVVKVLDTKGGVHTSKIVVK